MRVFIVNSTTDEQRYVTNSKKLADLVRQIMYDNRDASETEYYVTSADLIDDVDQLSKFVYLDAEKDEGDSLIYFYREDGSWWRTYTTPDRAEAIIKDLPHFTKWEVGKDSN